jgi:hypothetical protein
MVSSSCSAATFSPGSAWRLETMPLMGATRAASRSWMRAVSTWARAALYWALALSSEAREFSSAIGEMNFCSASPRLESWLRWAWASRALAASAWAVFSFRRALSSARSMTPSDSPR